MAPARCACATERHAGADPVRTTIDPPRAHGRRAWRHAGGGTGAELHHLAAGNAWSSKLPYADDASSRPSTPMSSRMKIRYAGVRFEFATLSAGAAILCRYRARATPSECRRARRRSARGCAVSLPRIEPYRSFLMLRPGWILFLQQTNRTIEQTISAFLRAAQGGRCRHAYRHHQGRRRAGDAAATDDVSRD